MGECTNVWPWHLTSTCEIVTTDYVPWSKFGLPILLAGHQSTFNPASSDSFAGIKNPLNFAPLPTCTWDAQIPVQSKPEFLNLLSD